VVVSIELAVQGDRCGGSAVGSRQLGLSEHFATVGEQLQPAQQHTAAGKNLSSLRPVGLVRGGLQFGAGSSVGRVAE
jgi:hypothetical protein